MKLPRYQSYRNSGLAHLGYVPERWSLERFSARTSTHRDTATPQKLEGQRVFHYSIPAIQETGTGVEEEGDTIDSNKLLVRELQLLVSKLNPHKQVVLLASPHEGLTTVASTEFVPLISKDASAQYISYVWQSPICMHYLLARCDSATRSHQRASPADITQMVWAWPSHEEQSAIAAFLDREIAKIDALIAEQERLLELLAEKRQAVISHAVTKGLNPDAPMKGSGVAWLGELPAHWEVVQLRRSIAKFEQGWSPDCEARPAEETEWGVLKAGCVNGGFFVESENKALPPTLAPRPELMIKAGDLLMSRASGSPKLIGSVAMVENLTSRLMLSDKIFRLNVTSSVEPRYLAVVMGSIPLRQQIEQSIGGAEGLANNLPQARIKEFWLAVPPKAEQLEILRFVDAEASRLSALAEEAKKATTLLLERRSALIAAAVTGQIDVREAA